MKDNITIAQAGVVARKCKELLLTMKNVEKVEIHVEVPLY